MVSLEYSYVPARIGSKHETTTRTPSSSPERDSVKGVHFARCHKSSTRMLCAEGQWCLYDFEVHASRCKACYNPTLVIAGGRQLCSTGSLLAQDVAEFVCLVDGVPCDPHKEDHKYVRVKIPFEYVQTAQLLAVMHLVTRRRKRSSTRSSSDSHSSGKGRLHPDSLDLKEATLKAEREWGRSRSLSPRADDDKPSTTYRYRSRGDRNSVYSTAATGSPQQTFRTEVRTPESSPSRKPTERRHSVCNSGSGSPPPFYRVEVRTPERVKRQSYCLTPESNRLRK